MKSAVVVMMLLGCDCEAVQCRYLDTVSSHWVSVEACEADIERRIVAAEASYPLLEGRCVRTAENETPVLTSQTGASHLPVAAAENVIPVADGNNGTREDASEAQTVGLARSRFPGLTSWLASTRIVAGAVRNVKAGSLVRWLKANS